MIAEADNRRVVAVFTGGATALYRGTSSGRGRWGANGDGSGGGGGGRRFAP